VPEITRDGAPPVGRAADGKRAMKIGVFGGLIAGLIIVLLIVAYGTLFTVYQTRQALVERLGQPIRVVTEPGLNYKVPLIDN
jgi:membrane protease subunit HflC